MEVISQLVYDGIDVVKGIFGRNSSEANELTARQKSIIYGV